MEDFREINNQILEDFANIAIEDKLSLAFFKLPNESTIYAFRGKSITVEQINLEDSEQGFCLYPFNPSKDTPGYFIQAQKTISGAIPEDTYIKERSEVAFYDGNAVNEENNTELFKDIVASAIHQIKRNESVKKIVLAKSRTYQTHHFPDLIGIFLKLSKIHADAFVSLVSHPGAGTWLGATPETLVNETPDTFSTVALAGTQEALAPDSSSAVWTQKEIEEQALVSRYIINCFKKIRLREFEEDGPQTIQAANLFHLKTTFSVNLKEVDHPNLGSTMLHLLHPTSAVCGMPKQESLDFITEEEGLNRQYFSGFLGPVNMNGTHSLFVNLRCAKISKEKIILYSGAGITKDSEPEKEWTETELKMKTIGKWLVKEQNHL